MANPLGQNTMPSLWDDRRKQIEDTLAQERMRLQDFTSGRFRLGKRSEDGPWLDVTEQWVERHKRLILTFESVLAALNGEAIAKSERGVPWNG
jgi:hypothetical protein